MLFAIFGIIKPALRPLFSAPEFKAGAFEAPPTAAPGTETVEFAQTVAPYEQNLQVARQISQQDPKIVASVIKEWVNSNE